MIHSHEGSNDFCNIVTGVSLIGTSSIYNLPRLHTKNVKKSNKKEVSIKRYLIEHIIYTYYADYFVLLSNTLTLVKSLLYNLEQTAKCISLSVNLDKTGFLCFNQKDVVFSQNGKPLKLVDLFIHLCSNISSTDSDIKRCLVKHGLQLRSYRPYGNLIYLLK